MALSVRDLGQPHGIPDWTGPPPAYPLLPAMFGSKRRAPFNRTIVARRAGRPKPAEVSGAVRLRFEEDSYERPRPLRPIAMRSEHEVQAARLTTVVLQLEYAWRGRVAAAPLWPEADGWSDLDGWIISGHRLTADEIRSLLLLPLDGTAIKADRRFTSSLMQLRRRELCASVRRSPNDANVWRLADLGVTVRMALVQHLIEGFAPQRHDLPALKPLVRAIRSSARGASYGNLQAERLSR